MSAIDNAFIRAYTNDRTASGANVTARDVESATSAVAEAPQPMTSKIAVPKVSLAAAKAARSAMRPTAAADKVEPTNIVPANVVPAPHFDLAAFTYSSSTLDPFVKPIAEPIEHRESRSTGRPVVVPVRIDAGPQPTALRPAPVRRAEPIADDELHGTSVLLESGEPVDSAPAAESSADVVLPSEQPLLPQPMAPVSTLAVTMPDVATPNIGPQESTRQLRAGRSQFAAQITPPSETSHRAGYDVDRFEWPAVSDALLAKLVGGLDHLAGELVTESALGRKVVALTGLGRGEGRTALALTLARRLAAGGAKVLLVDADFESPQIAEQLGLLIDQGWNAALADGAPLWDAMVESLSDHLTVMPLAARPVAAAGALASRGSASGSPSVWVSTQTTMPRWDDLRHHFDVILIDAGPLGADDAGASGHGLPAAIAHSDVAIVAFDCRGSSRSQLAEAQRRLLDSAVFPLGVAETFCTE
jgi:Mrp family chromosome partitioning ATPase